MPQILHTKDFGDIEVARSFVKGNLHIVELTNGAYAHSSGLPVQSKDELREAIPKGPALEKALNWWEHRDDEVEAPKRSILIKPDGTLSFDDGTPVGSISEIIEHVPRGPFLDAAIKTFTMMQGIAQEEEKAAQTVAGKTAKKIAKSKPKPKTPKLDVKPVNQEKTTTAEGNVMVV
jgi:hypothetical protein